MKLFPLMLDLTDRLAVVVGAGPVGLRKAQALLAAKARVRVVTLPCAIDSPDLASVDWTREPYRAEHLEGAALVFAAATSDVNARVVQDARILGIWVNAADDSASGNFVMPAVVRRGELAITVSTGGAAPALSRRVRERLEKDFDSAWGDWIELLGELRPTILATIDDPSRRRLLFEQLADLAWLERLRTLGKEQTAAAMRRMVDDVCRR